MTSLEEVRARSAPLGPHSSVAALVPHYRCETWLGDSLESLLGQSRPLQAIVVIDDCSKSPPLDIVRRFPGVTLLRAAENVGPYRLIQQVISETAYDAYLFNDADDWSARERLEILLREAQRTGAELIGSQEVRVFCEDADALGYRYPLDVNAALREQPCSFPLLHPTSLVARGLVMRIGGFATAMRFSGDAEFLRRAGHVARIVNVPDPLYFRRKRPGALTTSPETGLRSSARLLVQQKLWQRARENARRVASGEAPDLTPLAVAGPIELRWLSGPRLRRGAEGGDPVILSADPVILSASEGSRRVPAAAADAEDSSRDPSLALRMTNAGIKATDPALRVTNAAATTTDPAAMTTPSASHAPRPIFVIGPPRSGVSLLTWCLSQHPGLAASPNARWMTRLALDLHAIVSEEAARTTGTEAVVAECCERELRGEFARAIDRLRRTQPHARRWVDGTPESVFHVPGLVKLFPHARFIHLVRDVAEVVESLVNLAAPDGSYFTVETAVERWLRATRAALDAERALGSEVVLRVRHADLVDSPEPTLRRCLAHVGEPYSRACLRPLAGLIAARPDRHGGEFTQSLNWHRAERLSKELLHEEQPQYPPDEALLAELTNAYAARGRHGSADLNEESTVERIREVARLAIPPESVVAVVSRGDDALLDLGGARGWHFPQTPDGTYAGHHPADSEDAIARLERIRQSGADFLLLPCTAFWWLDHYDGFRAHLDEHCRLAAYQENAAIIYALAPPHDRPRGAPRAVHSASPIRAGDIDPSTPIVPVASSPEVP